MKKWIGLAIAILLVVGGIYFGSPYLAARNLREAAISGDADRLDAAVDFPAVRESLKAQTSAALSQKLRDDPQVQANPYAGFATLLIPAVVDRTVDALVTPKGLAALLRGARPLRHRRAPGAEEPEVRRDFAWEGADRFRVTLFDTRRGGPRSSFVLERRGFASWKLVAVDLPADLFDAR